MDPEADARCVRVEGDRDAYRCFGAAHGFFWVKLFSFFAVWGGFWGLGLCSSLSPKVKRTIFFQGSPFQAPKDSTHRLSRTYGLYAQSLKLKPETGKPYTALSQEPWMLSLQSRMLGFAALGKTFKAKPSTLTVP